MWARVVAGSGSGVPLYAQAHVYLHGGIPGMRAAVTPPGQPAPHRTAYRYTGSALCTGLSRVEPERGPAAGGLIGLPTWFTPIALMTRHVRACPFVSSRGTTELICTASHHYRTHQSSTYVAVFYGCLVTLPITYVPIHLLVGLYRQHKQRHVSTQKTQNAQTCQICVGASTQNSTVS